MDDFKLELKLNAPAADVYDAIARKDGPTNWWTRLSEVSEEVGGVSRFKFPKADFFADMKVLTLEPNRLIEWECVDSKHAENSGWSDLRDWVGTKVRFEIVPNGSHASTLKFTHVGLIPKLECYNSCDSAWRYYLNESLRSLVEKGEGKPFEDS